MAYWYSVFLGRRESDGLLNQEFIGAWVNAPYHGADLIDEFAAFVGGGEPYPHA